MDRPQKELRRAGNVSEATEICRYFLYYLSLEPEMRKALIERSKPDWKISLHLQPEHLVESENVNRS